MAEYSMQNHGESLLDQLNKLPSPSSVDPHISSSNTSDNGLSNPFEPEKNTIVNSNGTPQSDDKIKTIMSMYPGSEQPKPQENGYWRPPMATSATTTSSIDNWPSYQVSPKPDYKTQSPVTSPIPPRNDVDTSSSYTQVPSASYSYPAPYTQPSVRTENPYTQPSARTETPYTQSPTTSYTQPSGRTESYQPSYQPTYPRYDSTKTEVSAPAAPQYQKTESKPEAVQYPKLESKPDAAQLLSQVQSLQQQQREQQQAIQQQMSQQLHMQKQLLAYQQTESQTKEFVEKMQASFNKIMGFMESVDSRLSNLEKVTQSILHNQNSATTTTTSRPPSMTPHPPSSNITSSSAVVSYPSASSVSYPSYAIPVPTYSNNTTTNGSYPALQSADEADALRKIEQFEEDQKLAKKLQEELELEAKRTSTSSSTSTKKPTSTPKEESVICPICSKQITLSEIESHADQCLESSSTTKKGNFFLGSAETYEIDANGQPTAAEKTGFFASLFGKKDATPTPAPATPAPVATTPKPAPPSATTRPATATATTTAPTTVAMPSPYPQPGPNGQFYQMPYMYAPYGYSQYPTQPGQQGGYYYYPGQQPTAQPPKKP